MAQNRKVELINLAIQSLAEAKTNQSLQNNDDDDAEYQLALSRLLSELESLKGDGVLEKSESSSPPPPEMVPSAIKKIKNVEDSEVDEECKENDEIVKELKKVRRQNFVTHCLLSVMIVLTTVWQLSEVAMVLKLRDGLNHPFRTFGSMITGMIKGPDKNGQETDNNKEQHLLESPILPSLNLPEGPQMDMSNLGK